MSAEANYADGTVREVAQGSTELSTFLSSAAGKNQLVLVDFSASWCGPCRVMLPVLSQIAQEFANKVVVAKVDCEASPANRNLASASGIQAFPTFHLYKNTEKVAEIRGANPQGIRAAIQQHLTMVPATSSTPPPVTAPPGELAKALAGSMAKMKQSCSTEAEFVTAAKTLLSLISNILDKPNEVKYHRIKATNTSFQSRLGSRPHADECLQLLGFGLQNSEWVMKQPVPAELSNVRALLQQVVPAGAPSSGGRPLPGATPQQLAQMLARAMGNSGNST